MAVALERLTPGGLTSLDAWWRAANYLTIGQIYLKDNALLRRQLTPEDIKPRLLGHWGTSPGLSFVYAHVSRLISLTSQVQIIHPLPNNPSIFTYLIGDRSKSSLAMARYKAAEADLLIQL